MENVVKENGNSKGIITIILFVLLLASVGFICYDKLLKKSESISKDCNCPICDKCSNKESENENSKLCKLDMNGKSNLNVLDECLKITNNNSDNVIIKNINVNGKVYELKYFFEPGIEKDEKDVTSYYENGITQIYINNKLLDAFPGQYRNVLMSLKIVNNKLVLSESFPSDVLPGDHTYDLSDFD